jgi:hypothetical protein
MQEALVAELRQQAHEEQGVDGKSAWESTAALSLPPALIQHVVDQGLRAEG